MLKRLTNIMCSFFCLRAIGFSAFALFDPVGFRRAAFQSVWEIRMLHTEMGLFDGIC